MAEWQQVRYLGVNPRATYFRVSIRPRVIGVPGSRVDIACMRNASGGTVELLAYSGPDERHAFAPRACDLGSLHLGFNVPDIDTALPKASRYCVEPMGEAIVIDADPNRGARIAYMRNAEGIVLELFQAP